MESSLHAASADGCGWSVPAHDALPLAPRRARYAVCLFVINEAERLHRQLAKMQAVDHGLAVVLADGTKLRLSRGYHDRVAALIKSGL